jgi:endonuclease/exonuclease/phosphatase (EEP) superfamily protein YafD
VLSTLAALLCVGVAVPTVARALGAEPGVLAIATALMPFVTLVAVGALVVALVSRNRAVILVAAALAVVNVAWQLPLYVADPGDAGTPALRVAASNLKFGSGDAQTVVDLVRSQQVDVLALEELTPDAVRRLHDAGLDDVLPYSISRADPSFSGTGLWSRLPISNERDIDGLAAHAVAGQVTDAGGTVVTVVAVHPLAPGAYDHSGRDEDFAVLRSALAAIPGSVVVAGDFNATRDQAPFRDLEADGFRDAADQAGAGFAPTFPNNRGARPLVAIDHVIARDLPQRATSWQTVAIPRSDHLAVVSVYG